VAFSGAGFTFIADVCSALDRRVGSPSSSDCMMLLTLSGRLKFSVKPAGRFGLERVCTGLSLMDEAHFVHLNVQCSKPSLPGATRWISMRAWHSGQRGRTVWRGDSLLVICASRIAHTLSHRKLARTGAARSWPHHNPKRQAGMFTCVLTIQARTSRKAR
jgi:hypothetical protein